MATLLALSVSFSCVYAIVTDITPLLRFPSD